MKKILLTQNKIAFVDDIDYDRVNNIVWRAQHSITQSTWYAVASGYPWLSMHRFVMRCDDDRIILHLNDDGLDNRRSNLRIGTHSDNQHLRWKNAKGYHWETSREVWKAMIHIDGKPTYLGRFTNEQDAANAYKNAKQKILARIFGSDVVEETEDGAED